MKSMISLMVALISMLLILVSCERSSGNQTSNEVSRGQDENNIIEITEHIHEYGEWEQTKFPTCIAAGEEKRVCSCGSVEIRAKGEPLGHKFGEWMTSKHPTESEDGEETATCSACSQKETRILYATGTPGLIFTLIDDGQSYSVSAGTAVSGNVIIPAYHNRLPVTSIGYIGFSDGIEGEAGEITATAGEYAFFNCADLKKVVIPSTVTTIGDMAFAKCESLERIVIPENVSDIGEAAFMECTKLKSVLFDINSRLEQISPYTFALCSNLKSIVIPESVKSIGASAFALDAEDLWNPYYDDLLIDIPDSTVKLVIKEYAILTGGGVELYYLDENGNEILIENTSFSDDGYCPFHAGKYEVIHNGDGTFTVRAPLNPSDARENWKEKTYDLPNCVSMIVPKVPVNRFVVYYGGTNIISWDEITIDDKNNQLRNAKIYCYSESEPDNDRNFWHYAEDIPTAW